MNSPFKFPTIFKSVQASGGDDSAIPAPPLPWSFHGFFGALDVASARRGWEVYRTVCAACHSLDQLSYRHLVGTLFTESEVKQFASEVEIEDGPDSSGEMFLRPGILSDAIVQPYKNEEAAKAANNGAAPPDLSLITKARVGYEDYVFALLTGYYLDEDVLHKPHGVDLGEDKFWNPYFDGGIIAMRPPLYDEACEYTDGTEATLSQLSKDVVTFLHWAAEPEQDDRKKMGLATLSFLTFATGVSWYMKRFRFSVLKNRKILFND